MKKRILKKIASTPAGMMVKDIEPNRLRRLAAWFVIALMSSEGLVEGHEASVENPMDIPDVYWRITDKGIWFLSR